MPITTFSGTVEDGQVKLAANVHLPEKAKVYVVVPDCEEQANGKKFDLKELVSRMPADYQATEEDFGGPQYDLKNLKVRKLGPSRKRFGQTSIETGEDSEYSSGDSSEDTSDESDLC